MALRNDNYINIQGWMYKLGLTKLNELNAYAIIHGFSQDAESVYKGGYSYMADLLLCDKRTVMRILTELENKGLIIKSQKEINGVKFNRYKVSDYSLTFCQGGFSVFALRPRHPPSIPVSKAHKERSEDSAQFRFTAASLDKGLNYLFVIVFRAFRRVFLLFWLIFCQNVRKCVK